MPRNGLEWAALAISLAAIVGLVGFLVVDGFADGGRPATIEIEQRLDEAGTAPTGWVLPLTVRNTGGQGAERLVVEASATVAGREERAVVTIDLLPAGTEAEVTVGFSGPPGDGVEVVVRGFQAP